MPPRGKRSGKKKNVASARTPYQGTSYAEGRCFGAWPAHASPLDHPATTRASTHPPPQSSAPWVGHMPHTCMQHQQPRTAPPSYRVRRTSLSNPPPPFLLHPCTRHLTHHAMPAPSPLMQGPAQCTHTHRRTVTVSHTVTHTHTHACMHAHTRVHTHTHTHTHIHTHSLSHTHTLSLTQESTSAPDARASGAPETRGGMR